LVPTRRPRDPRERTLRQGLAPAVFTNENYLVQHRSSFTESEAAELRRMIREKQTAGRAAQKALRAAMRARGFYISDFGDFGLHGFTVSDFDNLVTQGVVKITPE
jgi:hypothetical protein